MATNPNSEKSNSCVARVIDNIKKSNSDPWHYRGLELSNEMFVVLISHPDIDKAAAALDVYIGSLADPKDVPGIAHFLEHMLFMGSTKVNRSLKIYQRHLLFHYFDFSIQVKTIIRN